MGRPIRVIARDMGVAESTIHKWKRDVPEFNFAIEAELRSLEDLAEDELRGGFHVAASTVRRLLSCKNENVELGAARLMMESVDRLIARRSMQKEVEELREMVLQLKAEREGRATPV